RRHRLAEHRGGRGLDVLGRLAELDAAGLAAAAGVDLRLDDPLLAAERPGGFGRLVRRRGDLAGRHRDAVLREQFLGLVFVKIHAGYLRTGTRSRRRETTRRDAPSGMRLAVTGCRAARILCGSCGEIKTAVGNRERETGN